MIPPFEAPITLSPGAPAPVLISRPEGPVDLAPLIAGHWVLLLFFGSLAAPPCAEALDNLLARRPLFDGRDAMAIGVSFDPRDRTEHELADALPGLRYMWDLDRSVARAYGGAAGRAFRPIAILLDRTSRVVAQVPAAELDGLLDRMEALIAAERRDETPAPVLTVPRVFEPELCAALIAYYRAEGGKPSGFMIEKDGRTVLASDERLKRRSDVYVRDAGLQAEIRSRLVERLVPLVVRAFGWKPTRLERYLVSCYSSDERGFFFPHRDNVTTGTAHRQLAITLNLNAEDHQGGELRFPEFGDRLYKAPTGGAVVFGCGLLHEALPVTEGVRYAFLPFLYDEASAELRAANLDKVELSSPEEDTRLG